MVHVVSTPVVTIQMNTVEVVCDPNLDKNELTVWKKFRGLILGVVFACTLSLTNLIVKCLSHYHPTSISLWRNASIMFPALLLLLLYQFKQEGNKAIFGSVFPINNREKTILAAGLVMRGLFGGLARLLSVWAQKYLTIGDQSIFSSSTPIFVISFATVCLGESCGFVLSGLTILTIFGIALMTRPPFLTGQTSFDINNVTGVVFSVSGEVLSACVTIILRRVRKVHWLLLVLVSGIFGFLSNLVLAAAWEELALPVGWEDSLLTYLALPAVLSISQVSFALALKFEKAGPVSLVMSSQIVFSFLLQFATSEVLPDSYSCGGAAIVATVLVVSTYRKWVVELPVEDDRRKKLKFILF